MSSAGAADPARRTRPRDRSERIIEVATARFCEAGYHAVSLDEIGEAVGITGPAVYRHFDSKDALLLAVVDRMVERYGASYRAAIASEATANGRVRALVAATIGPQVDEQSFWSLALAELRHLPRASVRDLQRAADAAAQLWLDPLAELHPALGPSEVRFMLEVGGGLAASLVYYEPQLSTPRLTDLFTRMLLAAYGVDSAAVAGSAADPGAPPAAGTPLRTSARERILGQAVPLFRRYGFSGIGIDEIGRASGVTGPAVYRHFRNKEDLLYAAVGRAFEQIAAMVTRALAGASDADGALERLVDGYLRLVLAEPDLLAVCWGQKRGLSGDRRVTITRAERSCIDDWAGVLAQARDDLSEPEARAMVYAALGMLNGAAHADTAAGRALLRAMAVAALRA